MLKTICFVTTSNTVNYNSKIVFIFHISLVITTSLKNPFIHYFTIFILSSFHLFIHSSIKFFKIIVLIFNKSFIHLWKNIFYILQFPIYKGTLETFIWSEMWKLTSCLIRISSLLLFINNKCASALLQRNKNKQFEETKTWISISYLIRKSFQGYHCKSGIAIFAWRVTWNYAYSPFYVE